MEAIWFFEMNGRQFDWIQKPYEIGVFDTNKCYYVVFYKANQIAIYLWLGADQTDLKNVAEATKFLAETKFRWTENDQNRKEKNKMTSSIEMESGKSLQSLA